MNILIDPGTYSYHSKPPWSHALSLSKFHNTVTVDNTDQMDKLGKFMWASWSSGDVTHRMISNPIKYWEGSQASYERLRDPVRHRRAIVSLGKEHWLVLDYLEASKTHDFSLHWLLNDFPFEWDTKNNKIDLSIFDETYTIWVGSSCSLTSALVRADENSASGWQSRYYQDKMPAISLSFSSVDNVVLFWTALGPKIKEVNFFENQFTLRLDNAIFTLRLLLSDNRIVSSVFFEEIKEEFTRVNSVN